MVRKAFILAAGLGTRLGDQTTKKPKALVEFNGKPMLQQLIERLIKSGISEFVINIHHHGNQIIEFLENNNNFGVEIIISDEQEKLLNTGGAILKAGNYFTGNDPILVHNADVFSDINLKTLNDYHLRNNDLATLCVRKRESGRALLFNVEMQLSGWMNIQTNQFKWVDNPIDDYQAYAYSGIYLINPKFFQNIPMNGSFSIIDALLIMAKKHKISGFHDLSNIWFDLGTQDKIAKAENFLKVNNLD